MRVVDKDSLYGFIEYIDSIYISKYIPHKDCSFSLAELDSDTKVIRKFKVGDSVLKILFKDGYYSPIIATVLYGKTIELKSIGYKSSNVDINGNLIVVTPLEALRRLPVTDLVDAYNSFSVDSDRCSPEYMRIKLHLSKLSAYNLLCNNSRTGFASLRRLDVDRLIIESLADRVSLSIKSFI